jgi:hypothetical protein
LQKTGTGTAFLIASFTINRYKYQCTSSNFSSYKRIRAPNFTNLAFLQYLPEVSIAATCGGINKPQMERLLQPTHIVVATPGRLIDLIQRKAINLKETNFLVLDEADEMV